MAFWTDIYNNFVDRIVNGVSDRVLTAQGQRIATARAYRLGAQPKQLKVKPGAYDDNIIVNFVGLIIDRAVSQMIGGGIEFKFEEPENLAPVEGVPLAPAQPGQPSGEVPETKTGESEQKAYIEAFWDANHQEILLHKAALFASEAGTGFFLICDPAQGMGGVFGEDGVQYPRLTLLDPAFVTIDTLPEDYEVVIRYTVQYKFTGLDGKTAVRRRVIERDFENETADGVEKWTITDYEQSELTENKWVQVGDPLAWAYPFCPVIHWQNLPTVDSPYGEPEIDSGLMETQDSLNGLISALAKSVRQGSDPFRYSVGMDGVAKIEVGPDKIPNVPPGAEYRQLAPATDWQGSMAFSAWLRAAMFDITRTVDLDSLKDKLGAVTNFALRVLYADNLSKVETKRELFGDCLEEINRRVQWMKFGEAGVLDTDAIWPDFLPQNEQELITLIQTAQGMGIISKQTAFEALKKALGIEGTWEDEQARMESDNQQNQDLGTFLLRSFNRGEQGNNFPPMMQNQNQGAEMMNTPPGMGTAVG